MEPRMKAEISPLCPHHNRAMVLVRGEFGCGESGCNQRYDAEHGYREKVNERTFKPSTSTKLCPQCKEFHQYLARRGEIRLDDVWLCPNAAC
jgi:hypothetical protein